MTRELFWLTLTVILTGLLWVPYVLNRCQVRGLGGAMANPAQAPARAADAGAGMGGQGYCIRMMRWHRIRRERC